MTDRSRPHGLSELERPSGPQWTPPQSQWRIGTEGLGWLVYVPEGTNSSANARSDRQDLPHFERSEEQLRWTWPTIVSESGQRHDIRIVMTLATASDSLKCSLHIANGSDATVDSALFPWIRGIDLPGERHLAALTRDYFGAKKYSLWPTFDWNKGYYGTARPTLMTESLVGGNPMAPFTVMLDEQEALAATTDGPTPEITSWLWELDPGYSDTVGNQTHSADSGFQPVLRFSAVHLLDLAPAQERELTGITLQHAAGGWQQALTPYREHRTRLVDRTPPAAPPAWAAQPHSWYQIQLNSAVGERRYRFDDLPMLAQQCADNDVAVLHVIGWNTDGQDRNNPCHDPDPALGGADALADAITTCQSLGVKVVLFTKFTWADQATVRFRNELHRSAVRDPYGDYYRYQGYQYSTPHQLLDVSTRRLIPMCFLHEDYLRVCEAEFDKVVASGADGMLFDETMHHSPALLCYATDHGHDPGVSVYSGDQLLAQRLRQRLPRDRQDFLFAGETVYEDLQSSYQLSYIRSHYLDHQPLTRFVNPKLRMMTTVSGFDDRNQINQGLLYGYLYCYEPRHFKGTLKDFPSTLAYGRAADGLRRELAGHLWDGTYLGDAPLTLAPDGPHATAQWTSANADRLYLVANYDQSAPAQVSLDASVREIRSVESSWQPSSATVSIPPRSLVLLR